MPAASCPRSSLAASGAASAEASVDPQKGASRSAVSTAPTVHPRAERLAFVFEPANPMRHIMDPPVGRRKVSGHGVIPRDNHPFNSQLPNYL